MLCFLLRSGLLCVIFQDFVASLSISSIIIGGKGFVTNFPRRVGLHHNIKSLHNVGIMCYYLVATYMFIIVWIWCTLRSSRMGVLVG
jgi:hypothetical protein